ncbi:MAG TPA: ATP-binding protein, partial [Candidatus Polarisedimenticolaceae bacterium]
MLHRGQMRWMLWGLGIGLGPFVAFYVTPWGLGANVPDWADLFALPMLLVPAAFGAALSRYRLHDLDLLLRRGLAGVTLAFVVVGAYAAALLVLRRLVDDLALPPDLVTFLAALVTAVLYPKLRHGVRAGVDRAFYRARYSYRATLLEWGRELNAEMDLPALLDRLEERVRETLAVPHARVYVRGAGRQFDAARPGAAGERFSLEKATLEGLERGPAVPCAESGLPSAPWARHLFGMRVKGRVRAVLAVSDRGPFDPPFSSEDRALLATLCSQTATAIEAARLVREVRQHADEVETLRSRQERILESSGVGLLLADARGRILAWNRTLEAIYGLPKEEALGRSLQEVFPLHTIRALEREIAATPAGEEARLYRHALVNRVGQRIVVNLAVSAASGDGGDGARVVTFDDATERVKLEEQMLRQERLASLGLLAAGVAHEVNTPLTGISSYTQMLLEDLPEGDPRREALEKIEVQSRRASDIANSLLNLARPERAALEPIALNDAVREVVRLFEPQIRGKGIRLETRLDPLVPPVAGHRGKLQQVLLNLLLNARDAVDGEGKIAIATSCRGDRVILEVEDDGAGIAEEDLPRIFDPFFTTKGRGKGTGLGLSITYGIVREHDGEMQVESLPGTFTRFRVDLPAIAGGERAAEGAVR